MGDNSRTSDSSMDDLCDLSDFIKNAFVRNGEAELHTIDQISRQNRQTLSRLIQEFASVRMIDKTTDNRKITLEQNTNVAIEIPAAKKSNYDANHELSAVIAKCKNLQNSIKSAELQQLQLQDVISIIKRDVNNVANAYETEAKKVESKLKMYTSNFNCLFNIKSQDSNVIIAVVTFLINQEKSNYPIEFVISHADNNVIDFNAGNLLSQEQEQTLKMWFGENGNALCLFATLRRIVVTKHI